MTRTSIIAFACIALVGTASAFAQRAGEPAAPTQPPAPASATIPPDAQAAAQALKDSPRHGEWVDIEMKSPASELGGQSRKIKTWVVYPERSGKAPVVLVIHEIYGLTDWVRAVADQLAADGFIALAPDLLSGKGPDGGGTESLGDQVGQTIRSLPREEVAAMLNAARDYALALSSASDKSASIGFCWGGTASFNYATAQPALDAAIVYYGTAPGDKEALAKAACPVLGLYGGDDARVTSTVEGTSSAMKELNKPFEQHTFEGAGHGFLRQQSGRDGANLKAAREAWALTIAFLREHTE